MSASLNTRSSRSWTAIMLMLICILLIVALNALLLALFDFGLDFSAVQIQSIPTTSNAQSMNLAPLQRRDSNVMIFVKTFKTASSTFTSIMHNFCVLHNKSCAITKPFYLQRAWNFNLSSHRSDVYGVNTWNNQTGSSASNRLDLWLNHVLFHPFLYELIPTAQQQIVSIVRHPVHRFVSGFRYYRVRSRTGLNLSSYIRHLYASFQRDGAYTANYEPTPHIGYQLNSQCRSLIPGVVEPQKKDIFNVWNASILSGEWLLLIMEHFEASLLVLKHAYNLSFADFVYKSKKRSRSLDDYDLSTTEFEMLLQMNVCDWELYQTAENIFQQRLFEIYQNDTHRIQHDLQQLRTATNAQLKQCAGLKKEHINIANMQEFGFHNVSQYIFYKTVFCKSINKDNILWNKWAFDMRYNDSWRKAFVTRLLERDMLQY